MDVLEIFPIQLLLEENFYQYITKRNEKTALLQTHTIMLLEHYRINPQVMSSPCRHLLTHVLKCWQMYISNYFFCLEIAATRFAGQVMERIIRTTEITCHNGNLNCTIFCCYIPWIVFPFICQIMYNIIINNVKRECKLFLKGNRKTNNKE